ncbi:BRO-N domain-containing protein [Blautia wexlerae]|uniref:BRO-N domain-containing protein n=1 Tax=Blautia wexlerae TaxID=418240 RepID=UPI003D64D9B4
MQYPTWINESGLYSLILSSKLPSAKEFKHWVTSEVLPSIRKNGAYIRNQENMTPAEIVAHGLIAAQKIIEEREKG